MPANQEVVAYLRDAAIKRGIDAETALKVAQAEALNVFDPTKPDLGGDEQSSFGPFQLHYAGRSKSMPNAGLGDEFTKATGLRADDPKTWKQQIDFSLDYAKQHGWGSWMGAKAAGVSDYAGISGAKPRISGPLEAAGGGGGSDVGATQLYTPPPGATPAPTPTAAVVDLSALQKQNDPWSSLASGLASSVSAAGGGGTQPSDLPELAVPNLDAPSAIPPAPPAPPIGNIDTSGLADLFKLGDFGQAAALNTDRLGQPARKRQYG